MSGGWLMQLPAQFVQNVWIESYDPTIEDSYRKQIEVDVSKAGRCTIQHTDTRRAANAFWKCAALPCLSRSCGGANDMPIRLDTAGTEQFSTLLPGHLLDNLC